jgi:hypothetical protein
MVATATSSRKCDDVVPEFTTRGVTQNGSSTQKEEGRRREEGNAPSPAEEGNGQEGDAQEGSPPPPPQEDGLARIRFRRIDLLQEGHETPAGTRRPGFPSFGGSLR